MGEKWWGLLTGVRCTEGGWGGSHTNTWGKVTPCREMSSKAQGRNVPVSLEDSEDFSVAGAQ